MSLPTRQLLTDPLPRLLLAWLVCLGLAAQRLHHAVTQYGTEPGTPAEKVRGDGNDGHAQIDFGGQWLMGRMVVTGRGRELFHRDRHWEVVRAGYPRSREAPETQILAFPEAGRPATLRESDARHDAESLMGWTMGTDSPAWNRLAALVAAPFAGAGPLDASVLLAVAQAGATPALIAELETPAVGGPLYPPVHALMYAPLARLDPLPAYHLFQAISVALALLSGRLVRVITGDRVWTPVAAAAILVFPGCRSGLDLGQNHVLTLAVVLGGWALATRGRAFGGGMVWGLLAFKPVWGLAFAVVPLLQGRWRFVAGLAAAGVSLVLLTLPVVGVRSWLDWLTVGKEAAALYEVNERWIGLSRDLSGVVRRLAIDFRLPLAERASPVAGRLAWGLWGAVFVGTAVVFRLRRHRPEAEGFLFLGAVLTCYRFMYYDALLGVVPFVSLAARRPVSPRAALLSFPALMFALLLVCENGWLRLDVDFTLFSTVRVASDYHHPADTLLLLVLWAGLAVTLLRHPRSSSSAAPMSGDRMSDSPTSTA